MSIARGDLARRAALSGNLAVPEPWSSNDDPRVFAAIRDLRDEFRRLGITDPDGKGRLPDFLLDYENLPPIKPVALDRAHNRNSAATRWGQNGNLVEDSSDTLRLQRDPKTQEPLGLLYEPQRTQILTDPTDLDGAGWTLDDGSVTANQGSKKGLTYDVLDGALQEDYTRQTEGLAFAGSAIVEEDGGSNGLLLVKIEDDNTGISNFPRIDFDLSTQSISTIDTANITVIQAGIEDLGGGLYRVTFAGKPDSGFAHTQYKLDGSNGDGPLRVYHTQIENSREVTTPILTGNATRGADEVDYRFSFPDRTTGVVYSIEQQAGGRYSSGGGDPTEAIIRFGDTSFSSNSRHGVLYYRTGLNSHDLPSQDGLKTIARNSDDPVDGSPPLDETITQFSIDSSKTSPPNGAKFVVKQVAIHTQPHTQAQKGTLRDQYLTKA